MSASDQAAIDQFIKDIQSLKVHRAGGKPSLKKPVLLLVVLTKIEKGELKENRIRFNEIEPEYSRVYKQLTGNAGALTEPFFRMVTAPFWKLTLKDNWPTKGAPPPKSVLAARESWASLDERVFAALSPSGVRRCIDVLISAWLEPVVPNVRSVLS